MQKKQFILLCFLFINIYSQAQDSQPAIPVVCGLSHEDAFTQVLADESFLANARTAAATSTIEITYTGVPTEAKAAIEKAVSIWKTLIVSNIPIKINVTWTSMASTTLAVSGAETVYRDFTNAPKKSVWYIGPLAEALANKDLNSGGTDITVGLNSSINWYYGTDGKPTSGKYDLVTVALHEIAHGLGFVCTFSINSSNSLQGQWGQSGYPYIYETFIQDSQKRRLVNTAIFGNPSADLKTYLTNDALYFGLSNTTNYPRIYAPSTFTKGGSISHLNENSYAAGTANALMSPNIRSAEVIQKPGDVILSILSHLGWLINGFNGVIVTGTENIPESIAAVSVYPNPVEETLQILFASQTTPRDIAINLLDFNGKIIQTINKEAIYNDLLSLDVSSLPAGMYLISIQDGATKIVKKVVKR